MSGDLHPANLSGDNPGAQPGRPRITVRPMVGADLSFADSVRAMAGWNQTWEDWRRFLDLQPGGCFVGEWEGAPAGTATVTRYGSELAWVGMVLVHPDYRRRGIGRALLAHCLDVLGDVDCVKLDATPLGRPLYTQLGFIEEWPITRWEGIGPATHPPEPVFLQTRFDGRWTEVETLDKRVFGVSRVSLLEHLARQGPGCVHLNPAGAIGGYGFLRKGARAWYLGPVVAADADIGLSIARTLLARIRGELFFWDLPDLNRDGAGLALELGFKPQRALYRMYRGDNAHPGRPELVFGLADPALG